MLVIMSLIFINIDHFCSFIFLFKDYTSTNSIWTFFKEFVVTDVCRDNVMVKDLVASMPLLMTISVNSTV